MTILLGVLIALAVFALTFLVAGVRVITEFQRDVVFRFGRVRPRLQQPGVVLLIPLVDRLRKVNMQIITMPVPGQDGITRDNITVAPRRHHEARPTRVE